jgi:hypothetical protein
MDMDQISFPRRVRPLKLLHPLVSQSKGIIQCEEI